MLKQAEGARESTSNGCPYCLPWRTAWRQETGRLLWEGM